MPMLVLFCTNMTESYSLFNCNHMAVRSNSRRVSTVFLVTGADPQTHYDFGLLVMELDSPTILFPCPAPIFANLQVTLLNQKPIPRTDVGLLIEQDHYQSPSSVQARTVNISHDTRHLRSFGPIHASCASPHVGIHDQCKGLTVMHTLAPL